MKVDLSKLKGAWTEIVPDAKLSVKVVYVKVMERSLIMSGSTGLVHWRMCELASLAVQQTAVVNLHDVNRILIHLLK